MKTSPYTFPRKFSSLLEKTLLFFTFFTFTCLHHSLEAQSHRLNQEKYWLYRQRLLDRFIVVGTNPGEGIPAANYDDIYDAPGPNSPIANLRVLGWGDATAHLGYYIAMLATEQKLLRTHGYSTWATDWELYCALNALWRLDASSDLYSYDDADSINGACFTPSSAVPGPMNASTFDDATLLDGFFIRDDVPTTFASHWADVDAIASDLIAPTSKNCRNKEMSQDQVTAILLGLMCVKEFVPASLQYNGVPLVEFATTEAIRILEYCKANGGWTIRNPNIAGSPPVLRGPRGVGFPAAYVYAGLRFDSNVNLTNWLSILQNPMWQALQYPWYLVGTTKYMSEPMMANLAATGNSWGPCPYVITNPIVQYAACLFTTGATTGETRQGLDRYAGRAKEAQYLIHHLIYGSNWSNTNNVSDTSMVAMLNAAPCEGPYSPWPNTGIYGWTTENRFWVPRRDMTGDNDNLLNGKEHSTGQLYNGIDYMLLHNLYYLWRIENGYGDPFEFPYENLRATIIDHDWPLVVPLGPFYNGSHQLPMFLRSMDSITANSTIHAFPNVPSTDPRHGNVTYRAGTVIDLIDGFEVEYNAEFEAFIAPMECVNGIIQRIGGPMSPDELLIKSIYDAAEAEDDSLHAAFLDSLGITDEQHEHAWDSLLQAQFGDTLAGMKTAALNELLPVESMKASIFPNPTHAQATLRLEIPVSIEVEIRLLHADGRLNKYVFEMDSLEAGRHDFEISLEDLSAGLFKVVVTTQDEVIHLTLVKLE